MTPNDIANLVAFDHGARALAGLIGIVALFALVMLWRLPVGTCDRCDHCRLERERKEREQERLNREYAHRVGLAPRADEGVDDPPGQPRERPRDVPSVVVPPGPADPAARPLEVEAEDGAGDA